MKNDYILDLIGALVAVLIITPLAGCQFTRNAPLLETNINVQDSANGNTVPLGGL